MTQNLKNYKSKFPSENDGSVIEIKTAVHMDKKEGVAFEDALELAGFGKYNYRTLTLSIIILLAAFLEMTSVGIIMSASQCDLALDVFEKGIIGSVPVLGVIVSAHFWGYLADTRGRLFTLHICVIGTAAAAFLSSFANHWLFLMVAKLLSSIFASGTNFVTYALLGESTLQTHRARFLLYATTGIMITQAVTAGLAYAILQLNFAYYIPLLGFFYRPWRLIIQVIAFICLFNYFLFKYYVMESPKFYISKGKHDKALAVIKRIYAVNTGKNGDEYYVKRIFLEEDENETKSSNFFQSIWNQTVPLFQKKHIKNTILIFGISVPTYCMGPPFSVWMPFIFNNFQNMGEAGMSFCEIFHIQAQSDNNTVIEENGVDPVCDDTIADVTYAGLTTYACILTLISIFSVAIVKFIGKKCTYIGINIIATILAVVIDYVPVLWGVASLMGIMCNAVCMGITTSYAVELFPTYMRAMAVGLSMMVARAVSFIFYNIIGYQLLNNCSNFFLYVAVFLLAGAVLGFLLPSDRKPSSTIQSDDTSS